MKRRLILLAGMIIMLAPGTWLRSRPPPVTLTAGVEVSRLAVPVAKLGALSIEGVWQLDSRHSLFGSYSGLVALGSGALLAASDRGMAMRFAFSGGTPGGFALSPYSADGNGAMADKHTVDIEALTRDPATGRIWAAFEGRNAIERREADMTGPQGVRPAAMAGWSGNSGPEAMTRLADGRILVLGEGASGWRGGEFPGLLWADDPVAGGQPREFRFPLGGAFRPTDMAALPDGRVLILVRRIAFAVPPYFETALLVADADRIVPGQSWRAHELARFAPPFPGDNFEGLAVDPASGFPVTITMISDDNGAMYQRTLLVRMQWDGKVVR